jgi:hypothetical protein
VRQTSSAVIGHTITVTLQSQRSARLLVAIVVLTFVSLVWFGASGVRGEDQYWYVADVESLITGRGVQTNEVYPISVRHAPAALPRPFIHNVLNVYIAAIPAALVGPYAGWIVTNVIAGLLTAFLIYCTVTRYAQPSTAIVASLAYLFLPLTFWLTVQPLADATLAPLVALTVFIYATAGTTFWRWLSLAVVAGLLLLCRENFLLLMIAIPPAYLLSVRGWSPAIVVGAAGLSAVGVLFWSLKESLFESSVSFSYGQVLLNGTPGLPIMTPYFDLSGEVQTLHGLFTKAVSSLYIQFLQLFDEVFLAFYAPFNLLLLTFFIPRVKHAEFRRVFNAAAFYVLLHIVTAIVMVNQFRYLMVATSPLLIAAGVTLGQTRWWRAARISVAWTAVVLVLAASPNVAMSWRSHYEGVHDREVRNSLANAFAMLPTAADVMVALDLSKGFREQFLGFVLRPRRVLYMSDRYSSDDYATLMKSVEPKWLICLRRSPVLDRLAPRVAREVRRLPAPLADWSLFSIE